MAEMVRVRVQGFAPAEQGERLVFETTSPAAIAPTSPSGSAWIQEQLRAAQLQGGERLVMETLSAEAVDGPTGRAQRSGEKSSSGLRPRRTAHPARSSGAFRLAGVVEIASAAASKFDHQIDCPDCGKRWQLGALGVGSLGTLCCQHRCENRDCRRWYVIVFRVGAGRPAGAPRAQPGVLRAQLMGIRQLTSRDEEGLRAALAGIHGLIEEEIEIMVLITCILPDAGREEEA